MIDATRRIVIFDLDGTLANIDHRRHLVEGVQKDWRRFFAACRYDILNDPVAAAFFGFSKQFDRWIVSGRSDEVELETRVWLRDKGLFPDLLLMRKSGDYRSDVDLKREWLHSGIIPKDRVLCVFDDRDSVVAMWRAEGLPCFQVAPGNF